MNRTAALGLLFTAAAAIMSRPAAALALIGTEAQACGTFDWVFIATITSRKLFNQPDGASPRSPFYKLHLNVERVAHGDIPHHLTDVVRAYDVELGDMKVGSRILYLWAFLKDDPKRASSHHGEIPFYLKPEGPIPDEQTLRAIWDEHCDPATLTNAQDKHPTLPWLAMFPAGWLSWCQHYER